MSAGRKCHNSQGDFSPKQSRTGSHYEAKAPLRVVQPFIRQLKQTAIDMGSIPLSYAPQCHSRIVATAFLGRGLKTRNDTHSGGYGGGWPVLVQSVCDGQGCCSMRFLTSYTNDIFYKMLYNMTLRFSKNTAVLLRDSSLRIGMTWPFIIMGGAYKRGIDPISIAVSFS